MPFYAHTREDGQQKQLLLDHLTRTAEIARKLGADTGLGDLVYVAGLLHDLGKYSLIRLESEI
ncbi:MAG: HD domain-containing protein [Leptolinea sp.]|nr:HD domain-containing protein [Leptolinea sp.]